jgi:hypothetical protein
MMNDMAIATRESSAGRGIALETHRGLARAAAACSSSSSPSSSPE